MRKNQKERYQVGPAAILPGPSWSYMGFKKNNEMNEAAKHDSTWNGLNVAFSSFPNSTVDTCTSCTAQFFLELNKIFNRNVIFTKFHVVHVSGLCSIQVIMVDIMFHYCMPFSVDLSIVPL